MAYPVSPEMAAWLAGQQQRQAPAFLGPPVTPHPGQGNWNFQQQGQFEGQWPALAGVPGVAPPPFVGPPVHPGPGLPGKGFPGGKNGGLPRKDAFLGGKGAGLNLSWHGQQQRLRGMHPLQVLHQSLAAVGLVPQPDWGAPVSSAYPGS